MKPNSTNSNDHADETIVCLLQGEAFENRKKMLQMEVFSHLKKSDEIEDGFIFYFEYDETFFMKLMNYVLTENQCCPFFTFDTKLHAKNNIQLKITGPSEAKEMIKLELANNL